MPGRYVTMHHLVFTGVQIELPASIVALRIGVEPPGERKAEIDETAKRTNRPFRSDHNTVDGAAGHRVWSDTASHSCVAETVHGFELNSARADQPSVVRVEGIGLATEHEAQVAALIRARHQRKPASRQLQGKLVAIHLAGSGIAIREGGCVRSAQSDFRRGPGTTCR